MIYIKDFYADSDTEQIQMALDAVVSPDTEVVFERGRVYHITKPLLLQECVLKGEGCTLKLEEPCRYFFDLREGVRSENIYMMDFTFHGIPHMQAFTHIRITKNTKEVIL
jgi:hypothetical protein